MIDSYKFGSIIIDGREYTSDIIIYPDGRIQGSWWRVEGHRLCLDDIADLIETGPEIIIAGTGAYGFMKPDKSLENYLPTRGIEFTYAPSGKAVTLYNELSPRRKVGACFHLTC